MSRCPRGCCASAAEHYRSISAHPRARDVGGPNQRDAALGHDLAAYKVLRKQGYKPPRIDGSYDLARRATSEAEIRLGQVISDKDARRHKKGAALMTNMLEIADSMTGKMPEKNRGSKKVPMKKRPVD